MFEPHRSPSHRRLWDLLLAGALLGAFISMDSFAAEPLAVSPSEQHLMTDVFVTDAVIEAVHQATLAAETTGRIKEILFDVDDLVLQGEVLLRFTDREQQAGMARADAAYKEAMVHLQQAEADFRRTESVYIKKLVAKSALDKSATDLNAAQQRVKVAEADVKKAQEQLEYTVVRAPYAGIVVKRHVNKGEHVRPGTPLMTGFSLTKLRATASVPQSMIAPVRQHRQATISIEQAHAGVGQAIDAQSIVSNQITVYPYADKDSHNFTVRAELSSVPEGFYPGMFAKIQFVIGETSRLLIPASAVVYRSEVTAVYVVDQSGHVSFRAVRIGKRFTHAGENKVGENTVGISKEQTIEVLSGLVAGEQVALDPVKAGVQLKTQRTKKQD